MLTIRYGIDRQANSDLLLSDICRNAQNGRDGQTLIVPEQCSFDSEWRLCQNGGDSISAFAEVLSFSRLANRVFTVAGGAAQPTLDKSGRLIAMAGALEQARSRLKVYGRQIAKPEFLLQLLQMTDEFKSYGVESARLRELSGQLMGTLAEKTEELALILESYGSMCENAGQDPSDRLDKLRRKLWESAWAAGHSFYLDSFTDFTEQECGVIEELLKQSESVTVNLCCDDLHEGQSVFAVTRQTGQALLRMAARLNCEARVERVAPRQDNGAAAHCMAQLFAAVPQPFQSENPAIALHPAHSVAEECRGAVASIQKLVLSGSRYRDISVVYTDAGSYRPVLEELFRRYAIAGYFAGTRDVLGEPVIRMTLSALESAAFGMEADAVAEYLKSGYSPLDCEQCDRLENYAFLWNISGSRWEKPFTADPFGYGAKKPEQSQLLLAQLNEARELGVQPLLRLKDNLRAAKNTGEQVLALNSFLQEISLQERLQREVDALTAQDKHQKAQESVQIFAILARTLEQVFAVLGATVRTSEEFFRFFRAAVSQQTIGTIPATLDCVHVGSVSAMRYSRPAHLIFLGAREGLLPGIPAARSLLTDRERKQLQGLGLTLAPDAGGQMDRELLHVYLTLTAAGRTMEVSCDEAAPSYLYGRLKLLFPHSEVPPAEPLPATAELAAGAVAGLDSAQREQLLQSLPVLRAQTEQLLHRAAYAPGGLQEETVQALYGKTLRLSASRIDKYASCRLAFFLLYGLKAAQRKQVTMDAPVFGDFVHDVLEHTVAQVQREGGFAAVTLERTQELAAQFMEQFTNEYLKNLTDESYREMYLYERNCDEVRMIVQELYEELRQSEFIPAGVELGFGNGEEMDAVTIRGKRASCEITGSVDRVDLYRSGEKTYVRVVDYKTGTKSFNYSDILHGSGLQMLIYLFALEKNGEKAFGTRLEPAGVLYFPAKIPPLSSKTRPDGESVAKKRQKELRRKGLLLDDQELLLAMEPSVQPIYLPYTTDKEGTRTGDLATPARLQLLERYVEKTLVHMTDDIFSGSVAPQTIAHGDRNGLCDYCEFRQVCHFAGGCVPKQYVSAADNAAFWEELERREAEDGSL